MKHRKRVIFSPGAGTRKIEAERWNEIKRDTICLSKSNAAATLICRPFPFKSRRSSRIDPFALKRNQTEAEKSSRKSEWMGGKGKIRWKIKKGREKKTWAGSNPLRCAPRSTKLFANFKRDRSFIVWTREKYNDDDFYSSLSKFDNKILRKSHSRGQIISKK